MKKLALFSAALLLSNTVFAADAPFSTAPAPTQAYHSVSQTQPPMQSIAPTVSAVASPTPTPTQTATSTTAISNNNNGAAVINSGGQISQLAESTLTFEQQTNQRIQNLNNSNQIVDAELQTINKNIAQLQQKVGDTQKENESTSMIGGFFHAMNTEDFVSFIAFGISAIVLFGFGIMFGRSMFQSTAAQDNDKKTLKNKHKVGDLLADDTKSEYDFMATKEAIPAKLDLARSYLVMKDYEQANAILKTVLEKGDEEQRSVAEALLIKIKNTIS